MPDAGSHPEYVTWTQTLFALCAANEALTEQAHAESSDKSSFLYEILASRLTDDETIVSRAAKLKYRSHVPRCAIIFSFLAQAENGEGTNDEQFRAQFSRVLRETPGFNAEDFGDLLTRQQFVLFKTVPAGNIESRKNFLSNFVHDVLEENPLLDGLCVHVGIGTVYQDLPRMRDSYLEALFVVKNLSVLCTEGTMGFAEDYTFDYLMSLLSEDYQSSARPLCRPSASNFLSAGNAQGALRDEQQSAAMRQAPVHPSQHHAPALHEAHRNSRP